MVVTYRLEPDLGPSDFINPAGRKPLAGGAVALRSIIGGVADVWAPGLHY
jgi:hypothetical protein